MHVDILVLGASVEIRNNWTEISDDEFDLQVNTNLRAPMKLMQKFIPEMQGRHWGRVITMGSVQQVKPIPPMLIYSAMKAASLRFRAVIMTSVSFVLGIIPLLLASGAGAESRRHVGTVMFFGMSAATVFGVFLIPGLFVMMQRLREKLKKLLKRNKNDYDDDDEEEEYEDDDDE